MLGVVCGMVSEVEALGPFQRHRSVITAVGGARPEGAEDAARRLRDAGATLLLSCGVAGGLDPRLETGAVIAPTEVVAEGFGAAPAPLAVELLGEAAKSLRAEGGLLIGADQIVAEPGAKAALFAAGGRAVDMETHHVARVAAAAGLPCLALRTIADAAARGLPRSALNGLGPDGRPRPGKVLAALALRPLDLPELLAVKRDVDAALEALSRAVETAFPGLIAASGRKA